MQKSRPPVQWCRAAAPAVAAAPAPAAPPLQKKMQKSRPPVQNSRPPVHRLQLLSQLRARQRHSCAGCARCPAGQEQAAACQLPQQALGQRAPLLLLQPAELPQAAPGCLPCWRMQAVARQLPLLVRHPLRACVCCASSWEQAHPPPARPPPAAQLLRQLPLGQPQPLLLQQQGRKAWRRCRRRTPACCASRRQPGWAAQLPAQRLLPHLRRGACGPGCQSSAAAAAAAVAAAAGLPPDAGLPAAMAQSLAAPAAGAQCLQPPWTHCCHGSAAGGRCWAAAAAAQPPQPQPARLARPVPLPA